MLDIPFPHRALALVAVLAAVSGIEWWLRRGDAVRWRYSLFALGAGLVGAACGAAHDGVTVLIAPEYFSILKGLREDNIRRESILLGAQAGFSLGVIAAAVLAYVAERRRSHGNRPDLRTLATAWLMASMTSAAFGLLGGLGSYAALRANYLSTDLLGFSAHQGHSVVIVWIIHLCSYVGAGVGLAVRCYALLRGSKVARAHSPVLMEPGSP